MILRFIIVLALSMPAWATWTTTQTKCNAACASGTTCAITMTSTGAGHAIGVVVVLDSGTPGGPISAISGGGTYTDPGTTDVTLSATLRVDGWYTLNSTSGATTITVTLAATQAAWRACAVEFSSTTTFDFDVGGTRLQSSAVANPAGVTLTLTGSNDAIIQLISTTGTASGIAAPYGNTSFPNGNGIASAINTASGTGPTWTATSGTAALNAMAFKETAGGATPCQDLSSLGIGC